MSCSSAITAAFTAACQPLACPSATCYQAPEDSTARTTLRTAPNSVVLRRGPHLFGTPQDQALLGIECEGDGLPPGSEDKLAVGVEGGRNKETEGALCVSEEQADRLQKILVQEGPHGGLNKSGRRAVLETESERRPGREARLQPLCERDAQLLPRQPIYDEGLEVLLGLCRDLLELPIAYMSQAIGHSTRRLLRAIVSFGQDPM